ncbi:unnamed protein product [Linum tenue]|uniref:Uncharacterized protein n=1 Tax=Linum tenue TaxID=586396 RepID=A0AAV0IEH8_9ROSI|nr:unnamed protein product [Linum tenue]
MRSCESVSTPKLARLPKKLSVPPSKKQCTKTCLQPLDCSGCRFTIVLSRVATRRFCWKPRVERQRRRGMQGSADSK